MQANEAVVELPNHQPEPSKFMDKVRAYRNRKARGSRGASFAEADSGPLAQGMSRQGSSDKAPDLREFFASVSDAKVAVPEALN